LLELALDVFKNVDQSKTKIIGLKNLLSEKRDRRKSPRNRLGRIGGAPMTYTELKKRVLEANLSLPEYGW
jgi:hypothetical protein